MSNMAKNISSRSLQETEYAFFLMLRAFIKPAEAVHGHALPLHASDNPPEGTKTFLQSPW